MWLMPPAGSCSASGSGTVAELGLLLGAPVTVRKHLQFDNKQLQAFLLALGPLAVLPKKGVWVSQRRIYSCLKIG